MDLLLKLTTQNIKYDIHTEPGTLTVKQSAPSANPVSDSVDVNINTVNAKMDLDFSKTNESLGMKSVDRVYREAASNAVQAAGDATSEYVKMGNSLSQIQTGITVGDYFKNKNLSQASITGQLSLMEIESPEMRMENMAETTIDVSPASVEQNWNIEKNKMEYVPGKYHMEITQFPEVKIEYVGGMNYVPPSSAPDYEETEK